LDLWLHDTEYQRYDRQAHRLQEEENEAGSLLNLINARYLYDKLGGSLLREEKRR
jgi:hypothetical protein